MGIDRKWIDGRCCIRCRWGRFQVFYDPCNMELVYERAAFDGDEYVGWDTLETHDVSALTWKEIKAKIYNLLDYKK